MYSTSPRLAARVWIVLCLIASVVVLLGAAQPADAAASTGDGTTITAAHATDTKAVRNHERHAAAKLRQLRAPGHAPMLAAAATQFVSRPAHRGGANTSAGVTTHATPLVSTLYGRAPPKA